MILAQNRVRGLAASLATALTAAAMLAAPPSPARADEVITHVAIAAPRARVWAILTDFPSYPSWNPFIRRIEGRLAVGEEINADLHTTNLKPMTVKAKILIVDPNTQLRWLGSLPGLFSGEHYWKLTDRSDGGTDLEQGEVFRGIMVPFIKPERLRVDYEAMNTAMKARAEAAP
jgi:hypothetical protein